MQIYLYLKVPTRGPDRWIEPAGRENFIAGQGDVTRDMTRIPRVSRKLTGRVGSGQEVF